MSNADAGLISCVVFILGAIICSGIVSSVSQREKYLGLKLSRFFKTDVGKFSLSSRAFQGVDLPNVHIAIRKYAELHKGTYELIGYAGTGLRHVSQTNVQISLIPLQYDNIDIGTNERMECPRNGIYMVDCPDGKICFSAQLYYQGGATIELIAFSPSNDLNTKALEEIRELICHHSVFKGKILSLEGQEQTADVSNWLKIRFHEFAAVEKSEIILPPETMQLIERNVMSFYKHSDSLRKAGKSLKRGILFYGKPGTGKTITAKYLAQHLAGVTVFLLSGEQLWLVKEAFQLARLLAPSLVIMEDVDLIAHTRDETLGQTILHQLLNELDGLTKETEIIFLLTTNRPEVLEPALALRPGRVDQAIKFPLPDPICRQRLIEQYAKGVELQVKDMERLVSRTDGASPAFIQELLRKAALIAAEGNSFHTAERLLIEDEHLQKALDEMLLNGPLTRTLVGFHPQKEAKSGISP